MTPSTENTAALSKKTAESPPELSWIDDWTQLLDTKFLVPGTSLRFGADFLLGLVPGVGDLLSLGFSGALVASMAKHGASPMLVMKMLFNVALDATVGSIPILGNLFDLFYKANHRNFELMKEHYGEGKHNGSVWPTLLAIAVVLLLIFGGLIWATIWFAGWIASQFTA